MDTLRALEEALLSFAGCAVVISHDRWFLDRIATHILAFEGDSQVVWFEGNFQDYEADKKKRLGPEAEQPTANQVQAADPLRAARPGHRPLQSAGGGHQLAQHGRLTVDPSTASWKPLMSKRSPDAAGAPARRRRISRCPTL